MSGLAPLTRDEANLLSEIATRTFEVPAGAQLCVEGEPVQGPAALIAGWACSTRTLADGRRQIFGILLPGDLLGLSPTSDAVALHSVLALTACRVADASRLKMSLAQATGERNGLARACLMAAALEQAYLLNHVVRLGRQNAYERVAHFLLELASRLQAVGLSNGTQIVLPLTQEVMADALGLSLVHVNRTLQQLRRDRLIDFKPVSMKLLQPEMLAQIANYHPPRVAMSADA